MLDLHRLRLLCELRDRGTVIAVAAALNYSPSAVSQQLRVLEAETGAALLERAGRRVRLTEAGITLAAHGERLLAAAEEAEAELAASATGLSGSLRIAAFQTATLALIPPVLQQLAQSHPKLRIELHDIDPDAALHSLSLGGLDLVIADEWEYVPRDLHKGLVRNELMREAVRLVLPADHRLTAGGAPVRLADLVDDPWACGPSGSSHDRMTQRTCEQVGRFKPEVRHRSIDLLVLLALVRSGNAVSLMPDLVGADADPSVAVREVAGRTLTRALFTAIRASSARRPAVLAAQRALRDTADGIAISTRDLRHR